MANHISDRRLYTIPGSVLSRQANRYSVNVPLGGVYMRTDSHRSEFHTGMTFFISYHVCIMTGSFYISLCTYQCKPRGGGGAGGNAGKGWGFDGNTCQGKMIRNHWSS